MKLLLCLSLAIYLQASVSVGKKIYHEKCFHCHKIEGKYFASNKKAKEWKKFLQKGL
ncbi:hypothetical protein JHD50_06330 [Sulfurimonas sp. MAG313]|nr:hypothetical protein [Sulfurimonas sp. MAG313]MDF1880924.1 hypothetical protein [Sulfurimonas sp. MAG313]